MSDQTPDTRKLGQIGRAIVEGDYTVVEGEVSVASSHDPCAGHGGIDFCGDGFCRCADGHLVLTG